MRHQPASVTEDILRNAQVITPQLAEINNNVADNCKTCIQFKRNKPRPVVAAPLSLKFNDVLAMDLKILFTQKLYIIYFIDLFTRFVQGSVLKRKKPDGIVDSFIKTWIALGFGAPRKVLVDNGGEFDNPLYLEAMEQYGVEVCATGAYSPWSNGVCERNHHVVDLMIMKMLEEEPNMKLEIALANAVSAKNCLYNYKGFAPVQLVTGALPNLPSILNKELPALDKPDSSMVGDHLNNMYLARKAFIVVENSEKIARALKHPVRSCEEFFENGDRVFYKRTDERKWRGPARVVGQLGTVVHLVHGSRLLKYPSNRVIKFNGQQEQINNEEHSKINNKTNNKNSTDTQQKKIEVQKENNIDSSDKELEKNIDTRRRTSTRTSVTPVRYVPGESGGEWQKNVNEANVVMIPAERHLNPDVVESKIAELENWKKNEVVDVVEDKGQRRISTRWVITEKEFPDGNIKPKSRLVIRGFEEKEKDDLQKDAPTAAKTSLRIAFGIAVDNDWDVVCIDIKAAFLQSRLIEREVFVVPPKEANVEDGKLWRLRKPAYGLVDAARSWYLSLKEELLSLGCKQSQLDKSVFRWIITGKLQGIFLLHVDDFFLTGSVRFFKTVGHAIIDKYTVGTLKRSNFKYVGLNIHKHSAVLLMDQSSYSNDIKDVVFTANGRSNDEKLNKSELSELRSITGQIHWISSQTRPDISFDALELSIERNNASVGTMKRAKKIVKKIKERSSKILFQPIGEIVGLNVFTDASFCNLPDGKSSTCGIVVAIKGKSGERVLDWSSTKIQRVVSSTLEAEALALKEGLNNAIYLGCLLTELLYDDFKTNKIPIEAFVDNEPTERSIRSTKQVSEKRLRVDIGEIQRLIEEKEVKDVKWVSKNNQLADGLTKRDVNMNELMQWLSGNAS